MKQGVVAVVYVYRGLFFPSAAAEEEAPDSAEDILGSLAARGEAIPEDVFHDLIEFLQGVFFECALVIVFGHIPFIAVILESFIGVIEVCLPFRPEQLIADLSSKSKIPSQTSWGISM